MSFTVDNVKHTAILRYTEGLQQISGAYRALYDWHNEDEPRIRVAALTGPGTIPQWTGGSLTTAQMDTAGAVNVDYTKYGIQLQVDKYDQKDVPGIVQAASAKAGLAVAQTYATVAAAQFNNGFTNTTAVDSKSVFATDHTIKDSAATRSNKTTSALDRTAFMNAIQSYRNWVSYSGVSMDLVEAGFWLLIPPGLEETAVEILGSQYSSNQMQVNAAGAYNTTTVVWPFLTDSNNWFLMSKSTKLFGFFERSAPDFQVSYDADSKAWKLSIDFAVSGFVNPTPDGGFGAQV